MDLTSGPYVLTIGHSTRTSEALIQMLQEHGVERLVDVRTIPRSRHNPQFNREILAESLTRARIAYVHAEKLGGLRRPRPDSVNTGWRNRSFKGYADYMQTPQFHAALEVLITISEQERVVIMCSEAVPWRCHRSLIADALQVRGVTVGHIMSASRIQPHSITAFAIVRGPHISYPDADGSVTATRT